MTPPLVRRILPTALATVLVVGGALAATGCGQDEDITREEFLERFSETSPGDDAFNECVVDELFTQLDQEQINAFYGEPNTGLSDENTLAIQEASATCAAETASPPEAGTGIDDGSGETDTTGGG